MLVSERPSIQKNFFLNISIFGHPTIFISILPLIMGYFNLKFLLNKCSVY